MATCVVEAYYIDLNTERQDETRMFSVPPIMPCRNLKLLLLRLFSIDKSALVVFWVRYFPHPLGILHWTDG